MIKLETPFSALIILEGALSDLINRNSALTAHPALIQLETRSLEFPGFSKVENWFSTLIQLETTSPIEVKVRTAPSALIRLKTACADFSGFNKAGDGFSSSDKVRYSDGAGEYFLKHYWSVRNLRQLH